MRSDFMYVGTTKIRKTVVITSNPDKKTVNYLNTFSIIPDLSQSNTY